MRLTINHVSKSYGKTRALIDFCADLEPGIYALLGPNGSGKSTLIIAFIFFLFFISFSHRSKSALSRKGLVL